MHTGRRDTPTMLAPTKRRACEEVAASTTRIEGEIMSKRERKQTVVFKEQETQLQWGKVWFQNEPCTPSWISTTPPVLS